MVIQQMWLDFYTKHLHQAITALVHVQTSLATISMLFVITISIPWSVINIQYLQIIQNRHIDVDFDVKT